MIRAQMCHYHIFQNDNIEQKQMMSNQIYIFTSFVLYLLPSMEQTNNNLPNFLANALNKFSSTNCDNGSRHEKTKLVVSELKFGGKQKHDEFKTIFQNEEKGKKAKKKLIGIRKEIVEKQYPNPIKTIKYDNNKDVSGSMPRGKSMHLLGSIHYDSQLKDKKKIYNKKIFNQHDFQNQIGVLALEQYQTLDNSNNYRSLHQLPSIHKLNNIKIELENEPKEAQQIQTQKIAINKKSVSTSKLQTKNKQSKKNVYRQMGEKQTVVLRQKYEELNTVKMKQQYKNPQSKYFYINSLSLKNFIDQQKKYQQTGQNKITKNLLSRLKDSDRRSKNQNINFLYKKLSQPAPQQLMTKRARYQYNDKAEQKQQFMKKLTNMYKIQPKKKSQLPLIIKQENFVSGWNVNDEDQYFTGI